MRSHITFSQDVEFSEYVDIDIEIDDFINKLNKEQKEYVKKKLYAQSKIDWGEIEDVAGHKGRTDLTRIMAKFPKDTEYFRDIEYKEISLGDLLKTLDRDLLQVGETYSFDFEFFQRILLEDDFRNIKIFIPIKQAPMKIETKKWIFGMAPRIEEDWEDWEEEDSLYGK